ncbi:hypothetical protein ASD37_17010 [Mycobacterium sp. Root135]|nr:hypothetical protein ASD37_17010 [Mycobacterium sp. Root135]
MGHHRTRGVEDHRVAHGTGCAAEHLVNRGGVGLGVASGQLAQLGACEAEGRRVEDQAFDGAGLYAPDGARRRRGELVETVVAVHHQNARTSRREHACHHLGEVTPGASDQSGPR